MISCFRLHVNKAYTIFVRLIDRIMLGRQRITGMQFSDKQWARTECRLGPGVCGELRQCLSTAQIIVADNVDEFVYAQGLSLAEEESDQDGTRLFCINLDWKDVPNIVPPFDVFWIEWKVCTPLLKDLGFDTAGALIRSQDFGKHGDVRFCLAVDFFYTHPDDRRVIAFDNKTVNVFSSEEGKLLHVVIAGEDEWVCHPLLPPVLMAVSFMNCRNVRLVDAYPNKKLDRSHFRKTGVPLIRYKTIDVWPVCKLIRESPAGDESADAKRKRALHIVRGHFKRYKGAGLFGKYNGTFFWGQHVAGVESDARIVNDYRIRFDGKAPV